MNEIPFYERNMPLRSKSVRRLRDLLTEKDVALFVSDSVITVHTLSEDLADDDLHGHLARLCRLSPGYVAGTGIQLGAGRLITRVVGGWEVR